MANPCPPILLMHSASLEVGAPAGGCLGSPLGAPTLLSSPSPALLNSASFHASELWCGVATLPGPSCPAFPALRATALGPPQQDSAPPGLQLLGAGSVGAEGTLGPGSGEKQPGHSLAGSLLRPDLVPWAGSPPPRSIFLSCPRASGFASCVAWGVREPRGACRRECVGFALALGRAGGWGCRLRHRLHPVARRPLIPFSQLSPSEQSWWAASPGHRETRPFWGQAGRGCRAGQRPPAGWPECGGVRAPTDGWGLSSV